MWFRLKSRESKERSKRFITRKENIGSQVTIMRSHLKVNKLETHVLRKIKQYENGGTCYLDMIVEQKLINIFLLFSSDAHHYKVFI